MLLYRPLLAAYQNAGSAAARRFLLRELAHSRLHSEPDESLAAIERASPEPAEADPARLHAELSLEEQLLKLRLAPASAGSESGGLWTTVGHRRPTSRRLPASAATGTLDQAAARVLLPPARKLLAVPVTGTRVRAVASLGDLGSEGLPLLADELVNGSMAGVAAMALARLGSPGAGPAILRGIQQRGLETCTSWIGLALARVASEESVGLLLRLARAPEAAFREQAAIALEGFGEHDPESLLEPFQGETAPYVRLNVLLSISRLSRSIPGRTLLRLCRPDDPETVRVIALRAAAKIGDAEALKCLEVALMTGQPAEQSEAIEGLVVLERSTPEILTALRKSTTSLHPRLSLSALLGLAVWAPDEAFARLRLHFDESSARQWCIATYVLRYLRTSETVPLLVQLLRMVKGTELEEIAASALSRHLTHPDAADVLMSLVRRDAPPGLCSRVLEDLARHLPPDKRPSISAQIRTKLQTEQDPALVSPMLAALGSLGDASDLPQLCAFLHSPGVLGAVRGIELLGGTAASEALEELARSGPGEAREAAAIALFRLGRPQGILALETLVGSRTGAEGRHAAQALAQMALSSRHARVLPRLALLRTMLEEMQDVAGVAASKHGIETAPGERTSGSGSAVSFAGPLSSLDRPHSGVRSLLTGTRPSIGVAPTAGLTARPPKEGNQGVYSALGSHLLALDSGTWRGRRTALSMALLATWILAYLLIFRKTNEPTPQRIVTDSRKLRAPAVAGKAREPSAAPPRAVPPPGSWEEVKGNVVALPPGQVVVRSGGHYYILDGEPPSRHSVGEAVDLRTVVKGIDGLGIVHVEVR